MPFLQANQHVLISVGPERGCVLGPPILQWVRAEGEHIDLFLILAAQHFGRDGIIAATVRPVGPGDLTGGLGYSEPALQAASASSSPAPSAAVSSPARMRRRVALAGGDGGAIGDRLRRPHASCSATTRYISSAHCDFFLYPSGFLF